jgi:crotonobetaine/carnitine-CoA ligase
VSRFWRVAVEHRCTWSTLVAFCLRALASVEAPGEHYFRGWAGGSVTAVGAGPGGIGTTGWFGMTETISHPICSLPGLPGVVGSMGRPAPEYGVAVVDDDDRPVPTGEAGNLLVLGTRGLSLFAGYHDNPEATAKAFTDTGWFRTGDRVRAGEEGSITFVERDKDVLKVGGENIGAPEIERVVLGTPGVREVAVVGRPHPMLGEVPVVFVTVSGDPTEAETAIRQRCAGMLADFKRPREVFVIDDFPRSTLDKIAKAALRARVADPNPT